MNMKKSLIFTAFAPLALAFSACSGPAETAQSNETHTQSIFAGGNYAHNLSEVLTTSDGVEILTIVSLETKEQSVSGVPHDEMAVKARALASEFFSNLSREDITAEFRNVKKQASDYVTNGLKASGHDLVAAKFKKMAFGESKVKSEQNLRHILNDIEYADKTNCSMILKTCF